MTRPHPSAGVGCVRAAVTAVVAASLLALTGCVAAPRDVPAFRGDARASLESATSDTRTAQLALKHWLAGDVTGPYADVVVTEAEKALGPIAGVFGGVDPPADRADPLRDQVLQLLGDAEDATAAARIALRRGDRAGVADALKDLDDVSSNLETAAEKLS